MLQHLSIRNFILIRELDIDFQEGFTVITGETGAGKSIFLGALGLLLGERASADEISDPNLKCIVEGEFKIRNNVERTFFTDNDIEFNEHCIVRREIHPQGRSRAFINDTPVSLNVLKEFGEKLIDIHSQHSTILLSKNSFHLSLLDAISKTTDLYEDYLQKWAEYRTLITRLDFLKNNIEKQEKERDYYAFLVEEIEHAGINSEEMQALEEELKMTQHAEKIKTVLDGAVQSLKLSDQNMMKVLQQLFASCKSISDVFPQIDSLNDRMQSTMIDLDDIASEITVLNDKFSIDPTRVVQIEERLDLLNGLLHKHKVFTVNDLLKLKLEFQNKITTVDQQEEEITTLEKRVAEINKQLIFSAGEISAKRKVIIPQLEMKIISILTELGMPNAQFQVKMTISDQLSSKGFDEVAFFFSANKGEAPQELSKIASGGEMSRLMLALKSVIAESAALPTLIFDEIDTGISGEIARKMGIILKKMGNPIQLIVISHLPQIAAMASHHMLVSKIETDKTTYSVMENLKGEQRIIEIAKMLGGERYSDATLMTAKELMG